MSIGKKGTGYGLAVVLEIEIPGVDENVAKALADKAHKVCPYSNATRGKIGVHLIAK